MKPRKAYFFTDKTPINVKQQKDELSLILPLEAPVPLIPDTPIVISLELRNMLPSESLQTNSSRRLGKLGIED